MRILLDADGVLVDWSKAASRLMGVDDSDPVIRAKLKSAKDVVGIIGAWEDIYKVIDKAGESFWMGLEKFPWADSLVGALQGLDCQVAITTSVGKWAAGASAKHKYFAKAYPGLPLIITKAKEFCAGPTSLLIDDLSDNLKKFEAAGGLIYHWPNQYKLLDQDESVVKAIDDIEKIVRTVKKML